MANRHPANWLIHRNLSTSEWGWLPPNQISNNTSCCQPERFFRNLNCICIGEKHAVRVPRCKIFSWLELQDYCNKYAITYLFSQQSHDKNTKNFFYNYKMLPVWWTLPSMWHPGTVCNLSNRTQWPLVCVSVSPVCPEKEALTTVATTGSVGELSLEGVLGAAGAWQ